MLVSLSTWGWTSVYSSVSQWVLPLVSMSESRLECWLGWAYSSASVYW
ncbi:MAG: hypothetical protein ACHQ4J_10465 [Candidatus Binatia bacterium]